MSHLLVENNWLRIDFMEFDFFPAKFSSDTRPSSKVSRLVGVFTVFSRLLLSFSTWFSLWSCQKWSHSNYREYPAKRLQRKRHISASRDDNPILKKVPGKTFKPILFVLNLQIVSWKNNPHVISEISSIFLEESLFFLRKPLSVALSFTATYQ